VKWVLSTWILASIISPALQTEAWFLVSPIPISNTPLKPQHLQIKKKAHPHIAPHVHRVATHASCAQGRSGITEFKIKWPSAHHQRGVSSVCLTESTTHYHPACNDYCPFPSLTPHTTTSQNLMQANQNPYKWPKIPWTLYFWCPLAWTCAQHLGQWYMHSGSVINHVVIMYHPSECHQATHVV